MAFSGIAEPAAADKAEIVSVAWSVSDMHADNFK